MSEKPQLINSLTKGLKILEILQENSNIGVTELSRLLNVNKSSAYRLLATLEDRGFVEQVTDGGKYRLGMKLAKFKTKVLNDYELINTARPYLEKLASITDEASGVCIMRGNEGLLIDKHNSPQRIGATLVVGMTEPLYCTSLGKALLCSFSESEQRRLLEAVVPVKRTPATITDIEQIIKEAKENAKTGIALDDEEYDTGMRCIAAQVRDYTGNVVASIGISGPIDRLRTDKLDHYKSLVKQVADELSFKLGY